MTGLDQNASRQGGILSINNTTTDILGSNEIYTGRWERNGFSHVVVSAYSDVAGTIYIDYSDDRVTVNTHPVDGIPVTASKHTVESAEKFPRWFRVRYVNGGSSQNIFNLYTYFGEFDLLDKRTADTSTVNSSISVGDSASVKLLDANGGREYVAISTRDANLWLKFQAASVDNVQKGIFIPKDFTYEFYPDLVYTGEISAIADVGTANVYITEY